MTKQIFDEGCKNLAIAINVCLANKLRLPGLILLYASIDIMAWLNRPVCHIDVQRSDFISWVNEFLLPGTALKCKAIDIYSARCGLIHSYTAESRISRKGDAKQIWYAYAPKGAEDLQSLIDKDIKLSAIAVAVQIEQLFDAFSNGIKRFKQYLYHNPDQAKLVYERAHKFFSNMRLLD